MRVTTVQRARKDAGSCGKCGGAIPVGQPYRWTAAFRGPRKVRCMKAECSFRPSELESNDKLARLYEIREEMEGYEYQADDERAATLRETLEDWAERATEVAEEYEESFLVGKEDQARLALAHRETAMGRGSFDKAEEFYWSLRAAKNYAGGSQR